MTIKYEIKMLSDWLVGSGLDSGTDADIVALKDENGHPYIPGKTIKGLLRDALYEINDVQDSKCPKETIIKLFGSEIGGETTKGTAFFSNVTLNEDDKIALIKNEGLSDYLYRTIASTAIEKNGIAKEKSLRVSEVCIPVTLYGEIDDVLNEDEEIFKMAFRWLRHLGVNRNRGLGRCKLSVKN